MIMTAIPLQFDTQIPGQLLQRLEAVREQLILNGAIVVRREAGRGHTQRLRYRSARDPVTGKRRHLSLPLPTPETAFAVQQLLMVWRNQHDAEVHKTEAAERERRQEAREDREERRLWQQMAGGGRRRRQRIGREYDEALKAGPIALFKFGCRDPHLKPNRQPGRPLIPACLRTPPPDSGMTIRPATGAGHNFHRPSTDFE